MLICVTCIGGRMIMKIMNWDDVSILGTTRARMTQGARTKHFAEVNWVVATALDISILE